ncbi:MAG: hypothetical protein M1297_03280 [Nitrospirae bacterium]|jgi:flagellar motility protein MotE (MotC chaperone)|nr:hypothetical protein [Nitrospirota bacterium]
MNGIFGIRLSRFTVFVLALFLWAMPGTPALPAGTVEDSTSPAPASSPDRLLQIRQEEKRLLEIRQDLLRQIAVNRKIERAIARDRAFAEKLESKKIQQLIAIYEKMAPRTAASQIDIMPRKLVAVLIAGMNPRKASRIMRYVDPAVAIRITTDLTSRPVTGQDLRRSP